MVILQAPLYHKMRPSKRLIFWKPLVTFTTLVFECSPCTYWCNNSEKGPTGKVTYMQTCIPTLSWRVHPNTLIAAIWNLIFSHSISFCFSYNLLICSLNIVNIFTLKLQCIYLFDDSYTLEIRISTDAVKQVNFTETLFYKLEMIANFWGSLIYNFTAIKFYKFGPFLKINLTCCTFLNQLCNYASWSSLLHLQLWLLQVGVPLRLHCSY